MRLQRRSWTFPVVASTVSLLIVLAGCGSNGDVTTEVPPTDTPLPTATPSSSGSDLDQLRNQSMWATLERLQRGDYGAFDSLARSGDLSYVPVLTELLFSPLFLDQLAVDTIIEALHRLTGESFTARQWPEWIKWVGRHSEIQPPSEFIEFKIGLYQNIDAGLVSFFYPGVESRIRVEEITWGGVRKDGIPDLRYPPHVAADDATYLQTGDRVFGVSINGEHRAYPLRILNAHEMANDALGGEPFALAY